MHMNDYTESPMRAYTVLSVPAILPTLKDSYVYSVLYMKVSVIGHALAYRCVVCWTESLGQGVLRGCDVIDPVLRNTPYTRIAVC